MRLAVTPVLACLAALQLAGCASSPQDVRASATRSTHDLRMAPAQAAGCMARNAENVFRPLSTTLAADVRALPDGKSYEVITRMPGWPGTGVIYVFEVNPNGAGSKATIFGPANEPDFRTKAVAGC